MHEPRIFGNTKSIEPTYLLDGQIYELITPDIKRKLLLNDNNDFLEGYDSVLCGRLFCIATSNNQTMVIVKDIEDMDVVNETKAEQYNRLELSEPGVLDLEDPIYS